MSKNIMKTTKIFQVFLFLLIFTAVTVLSPLGIMQVSADEITTTVPAGSWPLGVAVNQSTHKVYVTNNSGNSVTVVDGQTNTVITTVSVGSGPKGVAVDETDNLIYVANFNGSSLTVIDGATDAVSTAISAVPVSGSPQGVAWDKSNNKIYVAHSNPTGLVTVINASTGAVEGTMSVDPYPAAIAANSNINKIYVAHESGAVTVIDGSSNTTSSAVTLPAGSASEGVAVDESTNMIYVANSGSGSVSVIDGSNNLVANVPLGQGSSPWGIAVYEATHKIYVANQSNLGVTVIDGNTNTVVQTISLVNNSTGIAAAVDQTLNKIYIGTLNNNNNLTVIDGSIIEAAGITGLTAPSAGASPEAASGLTPGDSRYTVSSLTWENLDGTSASLDGSGKFSNAGNLYQARIELTAGAGYKFPAAGLTPTVNAGIPAAGTVSGGDSNGLENKLTLVVTFPADLTAVSLSGMVAPMKDETPIGVSGLSPGNSSQYSVTDLTWEYYGGGSIDFDESDGKFPNGGAWIQARIVLTSQDGYKFPAGGLIPDVDGDGTAAEVGTVTGGDVSGNKLTFVVYFSDELSDYQTYISGLNPPAAGETPQTAGDLELYHDSSSGQYYCTVSALTWKNSDGSPATLSGGKFISGGSTYRAVIELTSQPGYKFPLAGFVPTVEDEGIYVSGAVSGGYVTGNKLTFEIAFSNDITAAGITGLVAPVKGAVPVTSGALTAVHPALYDVYLMWANPDGSPATLTNGKFNAGATYKAVIYLYSKTGYKFPLKSLTPSVDAGTPTSGSPDSAASGNSIGFEVTFPATASDAGYKAVTDITDVPGAGTAGSQIDLTGVTVTPTDATNKTIVWTVSNAGTTGVTNAMLTTGKFVPANAGSLTLTATINNGAASTADYTKNFTISIASSSNPGSGTGSGNGGGGGGGGGTSSEPSKPVTGGNTTTVTTETKATTDGSGKAAASVTKDQLSTAVNSAVTEAKKKSNGVTAVVEIKVDAPANSNSVETGIPKDALGLVVTGGTDALKISTPVASISFGTDALSGINKEAAGDVKITAAKVDASSLTEDTKQLVGDRPVFNFSVTSGNSTISQFGGNVTVAVPYTPKPGEDTDAVVIYYINSEGKPEAVANCKYDPATKTVSFTTNHFSKYAVGYNKVSFSDVKDGAWYGNAVEFAAARGIVTGTGSGNFDPAGKLTRGQLLVMLMRAYGIEADNNPSSNFSDAGNTYYTGYLAAAKRLGITEGLGNNLYAPDKQITRQEMFTLLYKTLKVIGRLPEGTGKASGALAGYGDADSVASWAKDASGSLASAGVIGGSNGKLSPKNTTTRAEMAQVLYNLLSK